MPAYLIPDSAEEVNIPMEQISFRPRLTHRDTNGQITYIEYEEI
jgi:hypothetical protein